MIIFPDRLRAIIHSEKKDSLNSSNYSYEDAQAIFTGLSRAVIRGSYVHPQVLRASIEGKDREEASKNNQYTQLLRCSDPQKPFDYNPKDLDPSGENDSLGKFSQSLPDKNKFYQSYQIESPIYGELEVSSYFSKDKKLIYTVIEGCLNKEKVRWLASAHKAEDSNDHGSFVNSTGLLNDLISLKGLNEAPVTYWESAKQLKKIESSPIKHIKDFFAYCDIWGAYTKGISKQIFRKENGWEDL